MSRWVCCLLVLSSLITRASAAAAQTPHAPPDTPPASSMPLRSPDGRLVVTATITDAPITIDGVLDEPVWTRAPAVSHFVQAEPSDGLPATEATDVRVAYDRRMLYIGATMRDETAGEGIVSQIRRDFGNADQDTFEVIIDTFADRQNGFLFMTNRAGARADQQVTNEGRETNASWDAVWFVRTKQSADGWTVEMAVPFSSLRFEPGATPVWGINFSRRIRRKNEVDFWSPVPRSYNLTRVSLAGDLAGLDAVTPGRNLQLKPYVTARSVRATGRGTTFDQQAAVGLDLKYGVTPALTLDVAANPDFAQVEADQRTVNLTQFSTFYPEKRDFFIENSGIFYMGDAARSNSASVTPTPDEDLLPFHSRRIGLRDDGTPIDIYGGGRLTGHAAGFEMGLLTLQTREAGATPSTNYTVARARRNLRPGSMIGALVLSRQSSRPGDSNRVFALDSNLRFGRTDWNSYAIKTSTPGVTRGQYAVRTSLNRETNFTHAKIGYMTIGDGFRDDLGYYRRTGDQKWFMDAGLRPRPVSLARHSIRELHPHAVWSYYTDLSGRMISKYLHTGFTFFSNGGGYVELAVNNRYDELERALTIASTAPPVAPGHYGWTEYSLRVNTDASRPISIATSFIVGGLWSGTQRSASVSVVVRPTNRMQMTASVNRTSGDLGLPASDFVTAVWTMRTNYSFTTNMFLDSLIQYDQDRDRFNANVRFNFIHHPLSDLFVVYNEQQFRNAPGILPGRSVIVKVTRMMAF
jgi:Domain of unknown function (DUF5916)/Carbohydrate family 9 binding domain-like